MKYLTPIFTLLLTVCVLSGQGQKLKRKPILIRPDTTKETTEKIPFHPDPKAAEKHLEVGDFYFKRDNLKAAEVRYREAVLYNPKWAKAYEKLAYVLEKQGAFKAALEVCRGFMEKNPSSKKVKDFQEKSQHLEREEQKKTGED